MQYRPFGRTGFNISALGFGAMRLPSAQVDGKQVFDTEASIRMMHRAFENGVNYIDTAPYYCDGESEVIVGKALKGWRDNVAVSSKNPIENSIGSGLACPSGSVAQEVGCGLYRLLPYVGHQSGGLQQ